MNLKLIQTHYFKASQELELTNDDVRIRTKSFFKTEELSVVFAVLNPQPVKNKGYLDFVSRVNGEALISLAVDKPNADSFNQFVSALSERCTNEYQRFLGR